MKQKRLLFSWLFLLAIPAMIYAQDYKSYNDLVITEYYHFSNSVGYFEVTNMGNDTLELSKYWMSASYNNLNNQPFEGGSQKITLGDSVGQVLLPGESYVWAKSNQNEDLDRYGNKMYPNDFINYELEKLADHVLYTRTNLPGSNMVNHRVHGLYCRADIDTIPDGIADSVQVDQFWLNGFEKNGLAESAFPIAGIVSNTPNMDRGWVRKPKFKKGNIDFDITRGTSIDDSEWLPIPKGLAVNDIMYTTVGVQMDQQDLVMTPISSDISIDLANMNISLPYETPKDSIFRKFNFGPNHAWDFFQGPDTTSYFCVDGDSIEIYVIGNELKTFRFALKPRSKSDAFVKVAPAIYKNTNGSFTKRYTASDGHTPMDTIGQIPFDTPLDTLQEYLVIDKNATVEIISFDGIVHPEAKDGDVLRVTSGSNTKDYKLSVWPYLANSSSAITAVIFPGIEIWENPKTFEMTDTMLNFVSGGFDYVVNLPKEVTTSPAVVAVPQSSNAMVYISRAKNLNGSEEERTVTIKVTAEDDSTEATYRFLLNVERETPPIVGNVFITDIAGRWNGNGATAIQIFNPSSTETVLASDYLIMHCDQADFNTWIEGGIWQGQSVKGLNSRIIRPGSVIAPDINGDPYFTPDFHVTNIELEPQEEWCTMHVTSWPNHGSNSSIELVDQIDMLSGNKMPNAAQHRDYWYDRWATEKPYEFVDPDDGAWLPMNSLSFPRFTSGPTFALWKIKEGASGDSIRDGIKPVYKNWYDDYELVDVVNGFSVTKSTYVLNYKQDGVDSTYRVLPKNGNIYRHPRVYTGNPVDLAAFGTPGHEGEWIPYGQSYTEAGGYKEESKSSPGVKGTQEFGRSRFKNHTMVTTAHIPYLTSKVYLISKGLSENESIMGVLEKTSVNTFMNNIIKLDTGIHVKVMSGAGLEKTNEDQLVSGDKVTSKAANGLSSVTYVVNIGKLDNNTTLTAKDGAEFSITALNINDVPFGMTLNDLMSKIEAPATAKVTITDGNEYVIPMETWEADTNATSRIDTKVRDSYVVEVTALDGVSKAKYKINFKDQEDVYVLSDVYTVIEDFKEINYVSNINVTNFLKNLIPSPGATLVVKNKMGQPRTVGMVQPHDVLVVDKGDVSILYHITLMTEEENDVATNKVQNTSAQVYPNPTAGNITINGLANATDLRIMNITGQLVRTVKVNGERVSIDLKQQPGIYFISVMNRNKVMETHKVILN